MAAAGGSWSKGKFYSAKMKRRLSETQRKQLRDKELNMTAGKYAKLHAKAEASKQEPRHTRRETGRERATRAITQTRQDAQTVNRELMRAPKRSPGVGKVVRTYGTNPIHIYQLRYEVRELDELVTSNTPSGAVNPAYPAELQPRDRTRIASQQQVDSIARNLSPDAYLEEFKSIDRGAPVVGDDDSAVESGNARTMALRRAAEMYPERYQAYREQLEAVAPEYGINPADVKRYERPVLVRTHAEPVDRVAFAQEANYQTILGMSDVERAQSDAARISTRDLLNLDIGEGDIDAALGRRSNREFIRGFVSSLPETERATVMTREGELTQSGTRRIKAAMFARVYGDTRIGERIFESTDDDMKNVSSGLIGSLGRMAQAEEMIQTGQRAQDLSITGDVTAAVGKLASLKESKMTVEDYIAQGKLWGPELTPTQERIMLAIHEKRRSGKKIREFLGGWADVVESQPHPSQAGMFGTAGESRDVLVGRWLSQAERGEQPAEQGGLFGAGATRPTFGGGVRENPIQVRGAL